MSDVVLYALDMLSLILSAEQTTGCKTTPKAYKTKVQLSVFMTMGPLFLRSIPPQVPISRNAV